MRPSRLAPLAAPLAALLVVLALAGPVAAKEGMMAVLDAPIPLGTPPGTELLVGVRVTVLTDQGVRPVEGSPIVLILTGRDGATTEAAGAVRSLTDTNHYEMEIAIPEGGVRKAQVVIRGSGSGGKRIDIDIPLQADPFTFGGISARTAQLAPAPTPAITPFPRASAVPAAVAAASAAPVAATGAVVAADGASGTAPVQGAPPTWWPAPFALVLLGLAVIVAVRMRAGRSAGPEA